MSKENIQQYSHKLLLEFKYNLDTFEKVYDIILYYIIHIIFAFHQIQFNFCINTINSSKDISPSLS